MAFQSVGPAGHYPPSDTLGNRNGTGTGHGTSSNGRGAEDPSFTFRHCTFEDLFAALHDFVILVGPDSDIESVWTSNPDFSDLVRTALLGRPIRDVLSPESYDHLFKWLQLGGIGRSEDAVQFPVQLSDGLHQFSLRVMPMAHAGSRLTTCCLYARDVTDRNRREETLRKSEALLRKAQEIGRMGCWEVNVTTDEGLWSEQMYHLLGLDPKGLPIDRERFNAMIHPDDREKVANLPGMASWSGQYQEHESRFILPDGRTRTFHTRAVPVTDGDARISHVVGLSQDITERKEFEERLQKSEVLLAQAERLANLGSWEFNVLTKKLTWSAQFYRMLGFEPGIEPPRYETHTVIHPDDMPDAIRDLNEIETNGKPLENELRFITSKGEVRLFHSRAVAIQDEAGRVVCIRGMSQDITDRRREEERVRLSEALLAQAERIANLGSWEYDLKTDRTTLSKSLLRLYGLDCSAEFTEEWYWSCVHPDDRRRARTLANRGWRNSKPYVYMVRFHRPNGRTRVHFVRGVPIVGSRGRPVGSIGVVQDITDQRRVVQDLRRLSQEVMRTRDQERREAARALHESAGQTLAALKMTLSRLKGAVARNEEKAQMLWKAAIDLTESAVREVRTVSYLMHPPLLDEAGLGAALRWYVTGFTDRSGIEVILEVDDHVGRQSQEIETTLFRMVQEALTNVHRYSGSRRAWIRITREKGKIHAEVRDEGRGLRVDSKALTKVAPLGVGISGMRERVEQLGGAFELESSPGHGTILRATLPLVRNSKDAILEPDESESHDAKQQRRKARGARA